MTRLVEVIWCVLALIWCVLALTLLFALCAIMTAAPIVSVALIATGRDDDGLALIGAWAILCALLLAGANKR